MDGLQNAIAEGDLSVKAIHEVTGGGAEYKGEQPGYDPFQSIGHHLALFCI